MRYGALHLYYLHIQSLFPAAAMAIMMHSPATLTPTCKTETLGCSRGLFPGLWFVTWPVGRYRARDPWAIFGPGPCATQTTGCASERRCGPSLQAGQGDSDGPPRAGCRRHPVWNGMYLHLETLEMFFLVYTRYIPGIYLYHSQTWYIPGIYQEYIF